MRILFAADVLPNPDSGAAGTEYQTIRSLRLLGNDVDEIWEQDLPHRIKHGNLHYLLELPKGYRDTIGQKCKNKTYDVIHVNQGHSYIAALDHVKLNRPGVFICRSHGLEDHMELVLKAWRRKLGIRNRSLLKSIPGKAIDILLLRHQKLAAKYVQGYIVSSSMDQQFLIDKHGFPSERVTCIPQAPPDLYTKLPALKMSPERLKKILHIGNFQYWKGPHAVVATINKRSSDQQSMELTWISQKADHLSIYKLLTPDARKRTCFIDWIPQDELISIYDQNGIFLYPPLFDGFGKVFLEAMSRGLCVIGTQTGGMRDIIKDGRNGYLVDSAGTVEIVEIIRSLWKNHDIAITISESAINTAILYSWNRVAKETAAFYQHILELPRDRFEK